MLVNPYPNLDKVCMEFSIIEATIQILDNNQEYEDVRWDVAKPIRIWITPG
jgi:hypothetical protein